MSVSYLIDDNQRVVRSRGRGIISTEDLQDWTSRLLADPRFNSEYRSLSDFRAVTEISVDSQALAQAASTPLFDSGALRAIVASTDHVYGVACTFASFAARIGQEVRVFREMRLAEEWLGLMLPPAEAASDAEGSNVSADALARTAA